MERIFQITAVILIGVAAYFLWRGNTDGVFISAVLGAVAFFLSIRFQVKERLKLRETDKEAQENNLQG
jgi:hypothetical protein